MQAASQSELQFDKCSLLLVETQKLSGRANLPSGSFKTGHISGTRRGLPSGK